MANLNAPPQDYAFSGKTGETLVRAPGTINAQVFYLERLENCKVYLLDHSAAIYVDCLKDCSVYIGPVSGSCMLRKCSNCSFSVAAQQLRTQDCTDLTLFLYTSSDPHIELSNRIKFAPYNFAYPAQDEHFAAAGFSPSRNLWTAVYDHNPSPGESHYELLPPKDFVEEIYELEGFGPAVNVVPRSTHYGGNLREEIVPGSLAEGRVERRELPPITIQGKFYSSQEEHGHGPEILVPERRHVPAQPTEAVVLSIPMREQRAEEFSMVESEEASTFVYFYRHSIGFVPSYLPVHGSLQGTIVSTLSRLNEKVKPYNEEMRELVVAALAALLSFLGLTLLFVLLKLWAGQTTGGVVFNLVFLLAGFVLAETTIFFKRKTLLRDAEATVLKFVNEENTRSYEQQKATLQATIERVEIRVHK